MPEYTYSLSAHAGLTLEAAEDALDRLAADRRVSAPALSVNLAESIVGATLTVDAVSEDVARLRAVWAFRDAVGAELAVAAEPVDA